MIVDAAKKVTAIAIIVMALTYVIPASAADGPALPPAAYKPLPVGTEIRYDDGLRTVTKQDGFTAVVKKQSKSGTTFLETYAVFGEIGTNVYVQESRAEPIEYELTPGSREKLEKLWPLAVGRETTYELMESASTYGPPGQIWTITLKVIATADIEAAGTKYRTFVVEEKARSDFNMSVVGRKWYDPATGLVVRATRTGTGLDFFGNNYKKSAVFRNGEETAFTLRNVTFPGGAAPAVANVAAAPIAPAPRPAEQDTAAKTGADQQTRDAELARLQFEAERAKQQAELARLKQETERARQEAEIARLKLEAERARKEIQAARQQAPAQPRAAPKPSSAYDGVEFGNYYALVIGIDNYQHLPKLKTAVNDAKVVAGVLQDNYGFQVKLLLNPDRAGIVDTLDLFRATLGSKDNLLIYYAGHGWLDQEADRGYWLPADAQSNRRTNWVSNDTITDTLRTVRAKHVMVVADSCYSGTLTRGANVALRSGDYWKRMAEKYARVALVSGGLEPVADAGGAGHSPFAKAFTDALRANDAVIDGVQLFNEVRRPVMLSSRQTPQYSDVRNAGHDGGDFLFVRKK